MVAAEKRDSMSKGNWELSFPTDLLIEKESSLFAHRFIKCASSFILDKRGLLDDKYFKSRKIENYHMAIFDKTHPPAERLNKKIDALKDAISKQYLREFAIVFYKKPDEEDIIEVFSFRLAYGEEGDIVLSVDSGFGTEYNQNLVQAKFTDLETTKQIFFPTIRKLHRCIKNLDTLPPEADASFRISFTNAAPKDYMPTGFEESLKFYQIDPEAQKYDFGTICGGHHKVQLLAASRLFKSVIDLDKTTNSVAMANSSIIAPAAKSKGTKGAQKKAARTEKRFPYGKSATLNKINGGAQGPA